MKEKKKLSLATKTFIGFGLGIVIGLVFGEKATIVKPLGTIFLNMIKMIVSDVDGTLLSHGILFHHSGSRELRRLEKASEHWREGGWTVCADICTLCRIRAYHGKHHQSRKRI